jgi:ABC-type phosphate/phosphonate transport system substrate-binding protein
LRELRRSKKGGTLGIPGLLPVCASLLLVLTSSLLPSARAQGGEEVVHSEMRLSRDFVLAGSPQEALAGIQAFAECVAEEVGRRWRRKNTILVDFAPPVGELARQLSSQEVQLAYVTAYEYVRLKQKVEGLLPLASAARTSERRSQRALAIVRADDNARSLDEMRGRTFAYLNRNSLISYLYPQWLLARSGELELEEFFGKVVKVTKEKSALYAVLLGDVDVTCVSDHLFKVLSEMNPALGRKLRVLSESPPLPLGVLVGGPGFHREAIPHTIAALCEDQGIATRIGETLRILRVGSMRRVEDADFEPVRNLVRLLDDVRRVHLDPICGRRLSAAEVGATDSLGGRPVRFCSPECKKRYAEHRARSAPDHPDRLYVIGVSPDLTYEGSLQDAREVVDLVMSRFTASCGDTLVVEILPDLETALGRLREGTMAAVHLTPAGYVWLRKRIPVRPLLRHCSLGDTFRALLVVGARATCRSVEDLRGRSLATSARERTPEEFFLRTLLRSLGKEAPTSYFEAVIRCPSEESALRAVAIGQADAALATSRTFEVLKDLRPALGRNLRILQSSEEMVVGPIAGHPDLPRDLIERLEDFGLHLHESDEGRALLDYFRTGRMVRATDADYEGIRRMLESLEESE